MGTVKPPVKLANVLFCFGLLLSLAAFVSPNWLRSRHAFNTCGLWQSWEFTLCQTVTKVINQDWYIAVVVFQTLSFGFAILTAFVILTYVFAGKIQDNLKRYVLLGCISSANVTVLSLLTGVILLGGYHQTLGGDKDVFGNTERYDLDWCVVIICLAAVCFLSGISSLAYYMRSDTGAFDLEQGA